jgi:hypothetical protein
MKTCAHLKPGQKGAGRRVVKLGAALLCVRYRYDEKRGVRLKTVEIDVEEKPCTPSSRYRDGGIVAVGVRHRKSSSGGAEGRRVESGTRSQSCGMFPTVLFMELNWWIESFWIKNDVHRWLHDTPGISPEMAPITIHRLINLTRKKFLI